MVWNRCQRSKLGHRNPDQFDYCCHVFTLIPHVTSFIHVEENRWSEDLFIFWLLLRLLLFSLCAAEELFVAYLIPSIENYVSWLASSHPPSHLRRLVHSAVVEELSLFSWTTPIFLWIWHCVIARLTHLVHCSQFQPWIEIVCTLEPSEPCFCSFLLLMTPHLRAHCSLVCCLTNLRKRISGVATCFFL